MWTESPWNAPTGPSWRDLRYVQSELANAQARLRQARADKAQILNEHLAERAEAAGLAAQLAYLKKSMGGEELQHLRMISQAATREEYRAQEARAAELNAWLNR